MSFTENDAAAESAIRAKLEQWLKVVRAKDIPAIMQHYAPEVRAFDAIAQLQFQGRDAYQQHWTACMEYCPGEMQMRLQDVQISAGEDIAFCSALCQCGGVDDKGEEHSGWMRMTACYLRLNGEWKVVHEHFSSPFDPMSNQVLQGLQP